MATFGIVASAHHGLVVCAGTAPKSSHFPIEILSACGQDALRSEPS